jgi:hypothetical protein
VAKRRYTRRAFLQAALASAGAAALPVSQSLVDVLRRTPGIGLTPASATYYFFDQAQAATAAALAARIVPTDRDPLTDKVVSPGAAEAFAVRFIDMFLAAFELPTGVADNPAIYLSGPYSGRWPYGDPATGTPSATYPPDAFEHGSGTGTQVQFLGLTANQALSWYLRIYGTLDGGPNQPPLPGWVTSGVLGAGNAWRSQVSSGLIPGAQNLRQLYVDGLAAFDAWAKQNFAVSSFAAASTQEQDALLLLASNPLLDAASSNGLPGLPAPLPNPVPPPAVAALFGVVVVHSMQGSYCLPEYSGGRSDRVERGQATWASIGFDGDTQPLGNSVYDENLTQNVPTEPENVWTNDGFGGGGSGYHPVGAYRELRPVSYPDADMDKTLISIDELAELIAALERAGAEVTAIVAGSLGL